MAEYDETVVSEHDGIKELDNQLPRWWVILFQLSMVFAVVYMLWFHVLGFGQGQEGKYADNKSRAEAAQAARQSDLLASMDLGSPSTLGEVLSEGSDIYQANCASCHHSTARGLIGPNLTDAYWLNGSEFADTMHIIAKGKLEKGMQAWESSLSLRQRHAVASYLYSIRGSNPPEPVRAPEGDLIEGSDSPTYNL
ncbi:cbb3-type cytochrome c oxidase N-terminal domain-containing protein [Kiritimatiellaeota bacterium B1221]|nr:cbb3-type cytochrome c oxidase N-terminal domain-containing protein [Kiritimatiellaeota bacterium B1221]